ncbi:hypothetical protein PFISCL1PPCAC_21898, partial [Pristionchus fissidentatus]
ICSCRRPDSECKFKHGDDDTSRYEPKQPTPKTIMCTYKKNGDCFYGQRCDYAHSEEERKRNLRVANAIKNPKYKTNLCKNFERGESQICKFSETCLYLHPGDPEYAACKKRLDAQWVPVAGDITRPMAYKSYAEAVRSCIAETKAKDTCALPTYRSENMITEVIDIAVSNGCTKDRWNEMCNDITQGYAKLDRLDRHITQWIDEKLESYTMKIAEAKSERVEIENKLREIVFEKNKYLNKDIVELHGFRHAQDALKLVKLRLREIRDDPTILPKNPHPHRRNTLTLITGAGNRSHEEPIILNAVLHFLDTHFDHKMLNVGCIVIPIKGEWFYD